MPMATPEAGDRDFNNVDVLLSLRIRSSNDDNVAPTPAPAPPRREAITLFGFVISPAPAPPTPNPNPPVQPANDNPAVASELNLFPIRLSPPNPTDHHVSRDDQDRKPAINPCTPARETCRARKRERSPSAAEENLSAKKTINEQQAVISSGRFEKRLTKSDLGDLSRLMLTRGYVSNCILPSLGAEAIVKVNNGGLEVRVFDQETESTHRLIFKLWPSSNSYVLCGNWNKVFVKRRDLKVNDKIVLNWDASSTTFNFHLHGRAQ